MTAAPARAQRMLALCADDFGLAPGISQAIAALARAQRLSALSCITNSANWTRAAPLLHGLPASVGVGLHINLSEGLPLSASLAKVWPRLPGLGELLARSHMGLLPMGPLRDEVRAQLDAFRAATGADPVHLDGHQHVHQFPGLRSLILQLAAGMARAPALRCCARTPGVGFGLKRWLIRHTGAQALRRELLGGGLAHNPVLLGVYDFRAPDYRRLFRGWLDATPDHGALLFCHPGQALAGEPHDAIAQARQRELDYLQSDALMEDLAQAGVRLGPVWQTAAGH